MPKKAIINPHLGVSDANLRTQLRSAIRKCWRHSARRAFVEAVRIPHKGANGRGRYGVVCVACGRVMGQSERSLVTLANGKLSKKPKLVYQVDHIDGCGTFTEFEHLQDYAQKVLYGKMRILCWDCHAAHTKEQNKSS